MLMLAIIIATVLVTAILSQRLMKGTQQFAA
jgi:hypothetical protein